MKRIPQKIIGATLGAYIGFSVYNQSNKIENSFISYMEDNRQSIEEKIDTPTYLATKVAIHAGMVFIGIFSSAIGFGATYECFSDIGKKDSELEKKVVE